ncbi:MAG: hypothetical protein MUP85_20835, partial [Candidatus Lokiarchaeota archaeon]|nr:hypothetical protein [Candidatus Lokiarchaeota archaeon]
EQELHLVLQFYSWKRALLNLQEIKNIQHFEKIDSINLISYRLIQRLFRAKKLIMRLFLQLKIDLYQ